MATTCCARTSSGLAGMRVSSMSPCSIRRTSTAASSRSPRCLGNTLARLGDPTWWPARPARCRPRATVVGDSTMTTRSTAAMSMPSSSEEVAATARRAPVLSPSSMARRCSRETEPWCALTISSPARPLSWAARRSTRVRLLEKMIVERWASTSSSRRGYIAGQMERRRGAPGSGAGRSRSGRVMSSTGTTISRSSRLSLGASTMVTGRGRQAPPATVPPPRKRAMTSRGRWVAERPMRCGGAPVISSRRSRDRARWEPRLVPATAWISSTMTRRTEVRISRAAEVRSRYRLSGVVMRMSGGRRSMARRSSAGVSPVRMAVVISGTGMPCPTAARAMPRSGSCKLRSMS